MVEDFLRKISTRKPQRRFGTLVRPPSPRFLHATNSALQRACTLPRATFLAFVSPVSRTPYVLPNFLLPLANPPQGLIGTAPSTELLQTWNTREQGLIDEHPGCCPAVALPPEPIGAYVGQEMDEKLRKKIYKEGARTVPGREHGGNVDIKVGIAKRSVDLC